MKFIRFKRDHAQIYVRQLTFWLYWPSIYLKKDHIGIYAKTVVNYRLSNDWKWKWAGALQVLGFGAGISFNHIDNPNYQEPQPCPPK